MGADDIRWSDPPGMSRIVVGIFTVSPAVPVKDRMRRETEVCVCIGDCRRKQPIIIYF